MTPADDEKELTLIDHLVELRDRILKSLTAVVLLFLCLFYFANDIYTYVAEPLISALPEGATMIAIDPTSPFFAPFTDLLCRRTFRCSLYFIPALVIHRSRLVQE